MTVNVVDLGYCLHAFFRGLCPELMMYSQSVLSILLQFFAVIHFLLSVLLQPFNPSAASF